jgi:hypothetical protein
LKRKKEGEKRKPRGNSFEKLKRKRRPRKEDEERLKKEEEEQLQRKRQKNAKLGKRRNGDREKKKRSGWLRRKLGKRKRNTSIVLAHRTDIIFCTGSLFKASAAFYSSEYQLQSSPAGRSFFKTDLHAILKKAQKAKKNSRTIFVRLFVYLLGASFLYLTSFTHTLE